MITYLDPTLRSWMSRCLEVADTVGLDQAPTAASRRQAATKQSNIVFGEFGAPGDQSVSKREHTVAGPAGPIRVFEYRPTGRTVVPALLLLHGGAWAIGSISEDVDDSLARWRAAQVDCAVFDVEYRLAPEHPFPGGLDDAYAVLAWLAAGAEPLGLVPGQIAVNGSSAGANLCAALTLLARDRGGPQLAGQVLEVPAVDLTGEPWEVVCPDGSNGIGTLQGTREDYLAGHDPADPLVSPLLAADLQGLPPAHIITAEVDPLRDQGIAYAARLRQAGVSVSCTCHYGATHGSAGLIGALRDARLWQSEVVNALKEFFTWAD